ncbi:MAG: class A beta-lactamase [Pyrinomonadaceae bacterium]|nr:class A beta-lactamase [Pyrinomonadaceae bacterium]MBP6213912.1 class A beta-lactamase [Pyrinomonadaceae bacterium]
MTRTTFFAIAALILISLSLFFASCKGRIDIPTEFPTPEPPPKSTPLPKIELKPDAELTTQIAKIAEVAKGKVGVAAVVVETGQFAGLNAEQQFPMQSVYKLPIAMAVMEQIKRGELALDEKIGVSKEDMVRAGQRSQLRDANPNGGEFTIRELILLSLVESDGTASDVLMRVAGGAVEIQAFLTQIGIRDIKVVNSEKEIGRDWETQYQNWATPLAAVELLRGMREWSGESDVDEKELVLHRFMIDSVPGTKRLKSELPKGTVVAHKTGTSGTQNGITAATNDIGIIWLPNGKHLAIAVFVSDSQADEKTREAVIAKITKAIWEKWKG